MRDFNKKLRVLLIDDNANHLRGIKELINLESSYDIVGTTTSANLGINLVKKYHPDIVLMDINMPVLDGYEATKEIRKYSAKVPIIAITAFAYASDEQRVMESGFDGYMPKPINARQLKAQLTDIMQKRIVLL